MNRLERLRRERGITQKELAELVGVSRGTVVNSERDDHELSAPVAKSFATYYGMSVAELLGLEQGS